MQADPRVYAFGDVSKFLLQTSVLRRQRDCRVFTAEEDLHAP